MNIFTAFEPGEIFILGIIIGVLLSILVYIILGEKKYYADDETEKYSPKAIEFIYSLVSLMEDLEGMKPSKFLPTFIFKCGQMPTFSGNFSRCKGIDLYRKVQKAQKKWAKAHFFRKVGREK